MVKSVVGVVFIIVLVCTSIHCEIFDLSVSIVEALIWRWKEHEIDLLKIDMIAIGRIFSYGINIPLLCSPGSLAQAVIWGWKQHDTRKLLFFDP